MPVIRHATPSDAKALASLAEATFRDTFAEHNTAEDINGYCSVTFGEAIQAKELNNPIYRTLVVEEEGQLVAYAQLRFGKSPRCVKDLPAAELQRIYVAKHWHGKGVAQALMQRCLTEASERGNASIWLGVWEQNPRAMAFYHKFGFEPEGEHYFTLGTDRQRDLIMVRSLKTCL